jgi:hypothetical protein
LGGAHFLKEVVMKIRWTLTTLMLPALVLPSLAAAEASPHVNMVLIYNRLGGFIAPLPVHELTVYDSGEAVLARRDGQNPTGKVCFASATAARVAELQGQLAAAGAFFLADDPLSAPPDTSTATLTFFVPRPNSDRARTNTFSYGGAASALYQQCEQAVQSFISDVFPDC